MSAVRDGSPLLPYEVVSGTSIGALNGWFVATGQYTKLRELWSGISELNLMRPKRRYAALNSPESDIVDLAISAVNLTGLPPKGDGRWKR